MRRVDGCTRQSTPVRTRRSTCDGVRAARRSHLLWPLREEADGATHYYWAGRWVMIIRLAVVVS